jgi:hypothetical protein
VNEHVESRVGPFERYHRPSEIMPRGAGNRLQGEEGPTSI